MISENLIKDFIKQLKCYKLAMGNSSWKYGREDRYINKTVARSFRFFSRPS